MALEIHNKMFNHSPRIIQLIYFPLISTPLFMYEMPVPKIQKKV